VLFVVRVIRSTEINKLLGHNAEFCKCQSTSYLHYPHCALDGLYNAACPTVIPIRYFPVPSLIHVSVHQSLCGSIAEYLNLS